MATLPETRYDHTAITGDTYMSPVFTLRDGAGTAINLAGATALVTVRAGRGRGAILTPTASLGGTAGTLSWTAPADETELLDPGEYEFGVRVTLTTGEVRTVLWGRLTFEPPKVEEA